MQPWAEGRPARRLRHRRDDPHPASRAVHGQPPMLGDGRRHLGQLDPFGHAYDLGGKIRVQGAAAARAAIRTMIDDGIGILAHHAALALVPGLDTARLRLLASLLAVGRRRLRRRPRGLLRALQSQHHLDQLFAA